MDLYLIVGNAHTRKASVVRSLTGCFNRNLRDIALASGRPALRLYVRAGCLQDTKTGPEEFQREVDAVRCDAVLCCLAPAAHATEPARCPSAADYLAHFRQGGWRLRAVAVLGQNGGGLRSPNLQQFPQAATAPINATAQAVRRHFGWV